MSRDKNRIELDSRYVKKLRLAAIDKGFRSPKALTKSLMDKDEIIHPKKISKKKNDNIVFW